MDGKKKSYKNMRFKACFNVPSLATPVSYLIRAKPVDF